MEDFCIDILLKTDKDTDFISKNDLYDEYKKWARINFCTCASNKCKFISYFEKTNTLYCILDKKLYGYIIKNKSNDNFNTDFTTVTFGKKID